MHGIAALLSLLCVAQLYSGSATKAKRQRDQRRAKERNRMTKRNVKQPLPPSLKVAEGLTWQGKGL